MTLASIVSRNDYVGDGSTNVYDYAFRIDSKSDLEVRVLNTSDEEVELTVETDYTVDGVGDSSGGSITLVDSSQAWINSTGDLTSGYKLTVRRAPSPTQQTSIRNQGTYYPETHEDAFDYLMMCIQDLHDQVARCIKLPVTAKVSEFDPVLPESVVGSISASLNTNSAGDGMDVGTSASQAIIAGTVNVVSGSRASPNNIVAGTGITVQAGYLRQTIFIQGSGGAVDVTANPQISAGDTVGQEIKLIGRSDTNTVTLDDGNGLKLNGTSVLGADDTMSLTWDGTNWVQEGLKE